MSNFGSRISGFFGGASGGGGGGGVTSIIAGDGISVNSATGNVTVSTPYRSYVCLITWDALNSVTILTELQNDDFNISLTRTNLGQFLLEDTGSPFLQGKTFVTIQENNAQGNGGDVEFYNNFIYRDSDDFIRVQVKYIDVANGTSGFADELTRVSVEIRVYP
jgi:hypothetical protein